MSSTPIIPGYYPDPSICRAGDKYYIANSSFEYVPGVPIWESSDLVTWDQVGNILTRPTQIVPTDGAASSGIYAPTLRYHGGRFWLVTTNVSDVQRGNLIVSSESPEGPWTDPVYTTGTLGFDPDLCWDEDGVCHLTWASAYPQDLQGIATVPVDPTTGELLGKPHLIWPGSGLAHAEGPHLYRINGWWYLLLAEGGTERGHAVTIARARTLDGEWEGAPHNPILTHRSTALPVQNTGHADLVELADGSWAMVYLGVRPRGVSPLFHTNGRETFIAKVDWIDGWPVINEDHFDVPERDHSFTDRFDSGALDVRWIAPGAGPERFVTLGASGATLISDDTDPAARLLACRVRDLAWSAQATVRAGEGRARFQVRIDADHFYGIDITAGAVVGLVNVGPARTVLESVAVTPGADVTVRIAAASAPAEGFRPANQPDLVSLSVVGADGNEQVLGEFDGRYLSTEVAGGFTGRVVGLEVLSGSVELTEFTYAT